MKTGKVAQIFKVDQKTVMSWVDLFPAFFTDSAKGTHGRAQRDFTDSDVYVLNTIYKLRGEGIRDWEEIRQRLKRGDRDKELPMVTPAIDNETSLVVQFAEIAALRTRIAEFEKDARQWYEERKEYLTTIQSQQEEINQLRSEMSKVELRLSKESHKEQVELHREYANLISELNHKIGLLEGKQSRNEENSRD